MKLRVQRSSPLGRQRAAVIELEGDSSPPAATSTVSSTRSRAIADARCASWTTRLILLGPSGLWISTPAADYIVCAASATPTRRAAIVCHELAHMLLGHEPEVGQAEAVQAVAQILAPNVDTVGGVSFSDPASV